MSKSLSSAAIQAFDDEVKHAYQGTGLIRPTVLVRTGVVGNQHKFNSMGKGTATPRIPQTDVVPMGISHAKQTATITDWNAPEYTDIFDQQKVNYSERAELAQIIGAAQSRREDQIILDALDAASITQIVGEDVGGTGTNLNTAKCRDAARYLNKAGVPRMDRNALVHANNLYGLLGDSDANTFDKNAIKALVDGEITRWLGFNFLIMEDRDEGGLPFTSPDRTTYFYHGGSMGSIGHAVGIDHRTEVNYIAEKTSWLANGLFAAGAVVRDVNGIVEVECDETGL